MNQIDLKNRHAVVTGGAQGIGLSTARRLLASGASVSLWDCDGELLSARTRIFAQMTKEHIDFMLSRIPRGRFLEVEEVSAMVAWLVSEENSFTTGAVFDLSGGRATY